MKNYITLKNDYFKVNIPESMKDYGNNVLKYSTNKLKEYLKFFNKDSYGKKIKCSFFIAHEDFIDRIKKLSPEAIPPSWATGCFYGEEIQILINQKNINEKFCTLAHESFHLLFQKFIYEKNNIDRIVWLDESLAGNFDGTTDKLIKNKKFIKIILDLKNNLKFPKMSSLDFSKENIITMNYNGYDLFKVVGRYLIETKNNKELLEYINNTNKVLNDGDIILEESIKYFCDKYNLN